MNESDFKAKYLKYKKKYLCEKKEEKRRWSLVNNIIRSLSRPGSASSIFDETKNEIIERITIDDLHIDKLISNPTEARVACPPPKVQGEPANLVLINKIGDMLSSKIPPEKYIRMLWSGYEHYCQHFACHLADELNKKQFKSAAIEQTTLSKKWLEFGDWNGQLAELQVIYNKLDSPHIQDKKIKQEFIDKKPEYIETTGKDIWDHLSEQWASMEGFDYNIIIIPPNLIKEKTLCKIEWPEINPKAQVCVIRYDSQKSTQCEIIIPPDKSIIVSESEKETEKKIFFEAQQFNYLFK